MRAIFALAAALCAAVPLSAQEPTMQFRKSTPVIFVDEIEPVLPFWKRLGFEPTASVPQDDKLGFAILARDGVEVMYQSRASVAADIPALAAEPFASRVNLFMEVSDIAEIIELLKDADIVVPERTTFYGAHEIGVRAPEGTIVVFAEMEQQ
ncbi:MAG: VOC family protein [Gemmatimonadales bacterium]